jgi:hypothetical protein
MFKCKFFDSLKFTLTPISLEVAQILLLVNSKNLKINLKSTRTLKIANY